MSKSLTQNSRIIPKIIHDRNGREVLAFFSVVEGATGYSVKLVGVRYQNEKVIVALPTAVKKSPFISTKSPYFESSENIISDFAFLTSQPTRAPNF